LVCLAELPLKGALPDSTLDIINDAAMLVQNDRILRVGRYKDLESEAIALKAERVSYPEKSVCIPAFIDAHTHICFAGNRANDYAMRNGGSSYLEIARAGGGIWESVSKTRAADHASLVTGIMERLDRLKNQGIATVEVKSGYGLTVESEIRMLEAIGEANTKTPLDLVPTCLAAHIKPNDFEGDHSQYLEYMADHLFPKLKSAKLCGRIDAFVEQEAFSPEITYAYLMKAKNLGFDITIHADQFTTGGSALAVRCGAISADHLEASTSREIKLLAESSVIATALPGASLGLGCAFTPARQLLDAGACLAIASDWNPGSAPMGNLVVEACILGTYQKLSNTELLAGMTFRAAAALNLKDRGRLKAGMKADFSVYNIEQFNEIFYYQGMKQPDELWKSGERIV